ncbi:hypothetical protein [Fictibacillus macauensis]|nr:hypothetical protein [Fictibacillus macauensis]
MAVYQVIMLMISFAMLVLKMVEELNRKSKKTPPAKKKSTSPKKRAKGA